MSPRLPLPLPAPFRRATAPIPSAPPRDTRTTTSSLCMSRSAASSSSSSSLLLPTHALALWPARAKALKGLPDPNPPTNIRAVARVAPPPELAKGRWLAGRLAGWLPQFSCVLLSREPWAPPPPLPPPPPPPQDMACGPNGKAAARRPGPQAGLHCNLDMGMGGCASSMMPQPRGCTSRFRATLLCTCECKCQGSLHSLVGDAARFGQQPTTSKGGGGVRCFA